MTQISAEFFSSTDICLLAVACGDQLEALDEIQELTSPGFPFKHLSNQICTWPIRAPVNHVIEITANQISSERCCDGVQVIYIFYVG